MERLSTAMFNKFFFLFFIMSLDYSLCTNMTTVGCLEEEREALSKFKQSLDDPGHQLSSWIGTNCCSWKGVLCSQSTGHVVKLDLRCKDGLNFSNCLTGREVKNCLLELSHLNYLDLSGNFFDGSPIPKFIGSMEHLSYLNLSRAGFSGIVPHHLGNLSRLRALDLSGNQDLRIDNVMWISQLSLLQHLDLSGTNLTRAEDLGKALHLLPSLIKVSLSSCGIGNLHLSPTFGNSSLANVQFLDISSNSLEGEFPRFILNMTSLEVLDTSYNDYLNSSLSSLSGLTSLAHLSLAGNRFNNNEGGLSTLLWNKCNLKTLDVAENMLNGELLRFNWNSSACLGYDLEILRLQDNELTGPLPDELGHLKHLKHLDLSGNLFTGAIPIALWNLTALRSLSLSSNQLNGTIPISLGKLSNLEELDLGANFLNGVIAEDHFTKLAMLKVIDMSFNALTFKVKSDWKPPFQLRRIWISSCKIKGGFPQWLQTQRGIEYLDFSNSTISGPLPKWINVMNLTSLSLSYNQMDGPIPIFSSNLRMLDLSHNIFSGPLPYDMGDLMPRLESLLLAGNVLKGVIPNSLCKMKSLRVLDLSENSFSGSIPNCWKDVVELELLKLSSNRLSGSIPETIGHLELLMWLQLNNNSISGDFPSALRNCSTLVALDIGENGFSGDLPKWIGEDLQELVALRLHKNMFTGTIPWGFCQLSSLKIMDLAGNNLTGNLPSCLGNLSGMKNSTLYYGSPFYFDALQNMRQAIKGLELEFTTNLRLLVNMDLSNNNLGGEIPQEMTNLSALLGLNLSHNFFTGSIPFSIGNMKSLESLDLSHNLLSSEIPGSMSELLFLERLNLSYNNFSGEIPTGPQLQVLDDPSVYVGNPELCGAPLQKKCNADDPSQSAPARDHHGGKDTEDMLFYITVMSGFGTGFWTVVAILVFKRSWRHSLFTFTDAVMERILLWIALKLANLKR